MEGRPLRPSLELCASAAKPPRITERARRQGATSFATYPRHSHSSALGRVWSMQGDSPALDAATLPAAKLPAHDADGAPRPQGKAADIGAYERPAAAKR